MALQLTLNQAFSNYISKLNVYLKIQKATRLYCRSCCLFYQKVKKTFKDQLSNIICTEHSWCPGDISAPLISQPDLAVLAHPDLPLYLCMLQRRRMTL